MLLFFVFVALPVAQGLYFHIAETERKCFIEEIPDETMVIGKRIGSWVNFTNVLYMSGLNELG